MPRIAPQTSSATNVPRHRRPNFRKRSTARRAFTLVSWAFLTTVVLLVLLVLVIPRLLGAVPLAVLTSSMEPSLPPGTLVVSQPVDPAEVGIGDVITYQPESGNRTLITHRVISVGYGEAGSTYVLQGDNSGAADDPIVEDQIMGKVIYSVPFVGYLTSALPTADRAWVITGIGGVLIAYSLFLVASAIRSKTSTSRVTPS
ncbi:signal peptidase I [Nesterenkonia sp. CF4.4]|uniref:signal peptidase I n=1 Tax=Nesterenkonia sp. CF4.4 TaxID=3373079 RepID=UPI003EE5AA3C